MRTHTPVWLTAALSLAVGVALSGDSPRPGIDWPSFRGPYARGVGEGAPAPTTWDVPGNKNVKWRVAVPGLAHSSPIVWGNQVCTASAVSGQPDPQLKVGLYGDIASVVDATPHRWLVVCYDKQTGKQRVDSLRALTAGHWCNSRAGSDS